MYEQINEKIKTGVYKATKGEFIGAALFLMDASEEENHPYDFLTVFNPESKQSHEITYEDWMEMTNLDGLEWVEEIPVAVQDAFLNKSSIAHLKGLTKE